MTKIFLYATSAAAGLSAFLLALGLAQGLLRARSVASSAPGQGAFHGLFGWLATLNRALVWVGLGEFVRKKSLAMGRPNLTPEVVLSMMELSAIAFGVTAAFLFYLAGWSVAWALLLALFGFFVPIIWINDQVKKRQQDIVRALPYALDLLTLAVEAGLDFQAAVAKVVEKGQPGPLREELGIMLGEIRLGKTREQALRNLAERVQIPQLSTFVSNLIQADRMGTSLGKVLRIQSTQMRIERTHRAEKLANEAPVKLLFPLIACIFPTVFFILFGPIVYRWIIAG